MDYILFILVTATLFLRPAELVPALTGLPIYNYLILICLIVSAPKILEQLQPDRLRRQPITIAVLGMVVAVAMSNLSRLDLWSTRIDTVDVIKIVLYYLLLVSTVDTLAKWKQFTYWVVLFTVILAGLAVGHYLGYFEIASLEAIQERSVDAATGERIEILRLRGTGIFNDPNDLSMILVCSMMICGMALLDARWGLARFAWLLPLVALGYTLTLTQSRGGLLSLVLASFTLFYTRYGLFKSVLAGSVMLPAVAVLFGGRQTDMSGAFSGGTGHSRVELWSEGLTLLRQNPLFGIGYGQYAEEVGQVAHNSFVHCFVELGFLGGAVFFGAFWLTLRVLWQLGNKRRLMTTLSGSETLAHVQPFIVAVVTGFIVSMMSLSRSYSIPTYLILGLVASYQGIVERRGIVADVKLDVAEVARIAIASVGFLVLVYVYIRVGFR